jgi:IS30 family transposase
MKSYRRLSRNERDEIAVMMNRGHSLRQVAFWLGRSHSSLSRELVRNKGSHRYRPADAHHSARLRQRNNHRRPLKLQNHPRLRRLVIRWLKKGWSPEIIAGRLKHHAGFPLVSYSSIYRWVRAEAQDLSRHLLRARLVPRPRGSGSWKKRSIPYRVSIHERPEIVNSRQEPGHWEVDLLCGPSRAAVQVFVERHTRFVRLTLLSNKTAQASYDALYSILSGVDVPLRSSITYDNGGENRLHAYINATFSTRSYFCDPSHAWEKGTVENTNGLIRRFLPNSTDLSTISPLKIERIQNWLNNRPRKCLNYLTPAEAFRACGALAT